jgi:hypothetical protein
VSESAAIDTPAEFGAFEVTTTAATRIAEADAVDLAELRRDLTRAGSRRVDAFSYTGELWFNPFLAAPPPTWLRVLSGFVYVLLCPAVQLRRVEIAIYLRKCAGEDSNLRPAA